MTGDGAAARWRKLATVLGELLDLPGDEREARLAGIASADPALHAELVPLLESAGRLGDRFEVSAGELLDVIPDEAGGMVPGQMVGPYRIISEIGRGGMGTVWEAERADDEYQKRVAIKAMPDGFSSPELRRRFRIERRLLASLQHRNIATLFDSGVTAEGQPWFAMEYVSGEPITRWCESRRLGPRETVLLFMQVCSAVQYAHARLVLHRDLKPGNVMVSDDGTVKLLDFGVAKLMDPDDPTGTDRTRTVLVPFTRAYAAPEQRRGEQVTVAADIYSLGVILYELLAGRRPPHQDGDAGASGAVPPYLPASRAILDRQESGGRERARAIRGDLDSILQMALRSEPERRYQSAQELRDDLQRWLAGKPVVAQPDSFGYRARMYLRRHRAGVTAAAVALTALVGATAVSLEQAAVARRERDRAVVEAERTRQVTQFFQNVLSAPSPLAQGREVTVLEAIDAAIPRIDSTFGDNPDLLVAVKNTLVSTLHDMGLHQRAAPLAEEALLLVTERDRGAPSQERADALYNLAGIEDRIGSSARAESLYRAAFDIYRILPGADTIALLGDYNNLAIAIHNQGRLAEAESLYRVTTGYQRMRGSRRALGVTLINHGTVLAEGGRYDEAEPLLREAVELLTETQGARSTSVAGALQVLAGIQLFQGNLREAERTARQSFELYREALGADNSATVTAQRILLNILADADRCEEAIPVAREILALRGGTLTDADMSVGTALMFGGWCEARLGRSSRGEEMAREALALRRSRFPPSHWAVSQAESFLGMILAGRGAGARGEALALLESGYAGLARELDTSHVRVRQARRWLEEVRGRRTENR